MTWFKTFLIAMCGHTFHVNINQTHYPCFYYWEEDKCEVTLVCTTGRSDRGVAERYKESVVCDGSEKNVPYKQARIQICYECSWVRGSDKPQPYYGFGKRMTAASVTCVRDNIYDD